MKLAQSQICEPSFSAPQNFRGGKQPTTLDAYCKALVELSGVYSKEQCVLHSVLAMAIHSVADPPLVSSNEPRDPGLPPSALPPDTVPD